MLKKSASLADISHRLRYVRYPPESRHFVSLIECPVYHWKAAGAAQYWICAKIELNDDRPGVGWMMPSR